VDVSSEWCYSYCCFHIFHYHRCRHPIQLNPLSLIYRQMTFPQILKKKKKILISYFS
jgi:hypothetical protein